MAHIVCAYANAYGYPTSRAYVRCEQRLGRSQRLADVVLLLGRQADERLELRLDPTASLLSCVRDAGARAARMQNSRVKEVLRQTIHLVVEALGRDGIAPNDRAECLDNVAGQPRTGEAIQPVHPCTLGRVALVVRRGYHLLLALHERVACLVQQLRIRRGSFVCHVESGLVHRN